MHCSLETADFYTPDICKDISQNFFRPYFHCCLLSSVHYCRDLSHIHFFICSSYIWFLYICSHLFITQQVYLEPTLWSAFSWLVSLVGRALYWYHRGHGFIFHTGLNFFLSGLVLLLVIEVVSITAKITFIFTSLSAVQIYDFHVFTVIYSISRILVVLYMFLKFPYFLKNFAIHSNYR